MEFRHVKYFLTLSEELHFRRAAEKLFIAQPALSRQIKDLENELEVTLFKRDKRNVSLTMAGKFLQIEGYQILKQMAFIKSAISDLGNTAKGTINIGCIGSAMVKVIPELMSQIGKVLPEIKTNIIEDTTQNLLNALSDGKIDLAFTRPHTRASNLIADSLYTESTVVAIAKNSRWSIDDMSIITDFKDVPFILYPREAGPAFRDQIVLFCSQNGFYPEIKHESIHAQSLLRLVEQDLGVSILPESLTKGHDLNIEYLAIKEMSIPLELVVSYRTDNKDEVLRNILQITKQQGKDTKHP